MLVFFDETFRDSLSYEGASFGALCGIAIPEKGLHSVATDVFQLKLKHFGSHFARDREIRTARLTSRRMKSQNVAPLFSVDCALELASKGRIHAGK
jgi:hypothetical protein